MRLVAGGASLPTPLTVHCVVLASDVEPLLYVGGGGGGGGGGRLLGVVDRGGAVRGALDAVATSPVTALLHVDRLLVVGHANGLLSVFS